MDLENYVFSLIGSLPTMLVWLAGAVGCVVFAGRNPRGCMLAGAGLTLFVAARIAMPFMTSWIFSSLNNVPWFLEIRWRVLVNSLVYSIPTALAFGLLLAAVFFGNPQSVTFPTRSTPASTP